MPCSMCHTVTSVTRDSHVSHSRQSVSHQDSVLGPLLFLLHPSELFSIVENNPYGYADDFTLVGVVRSPLDKVSIIESLNRDLNRDSKYCGLWGTKLNERKTKTMIVSRSSHHQLPH